MNQNFLLLIYFFTSLIFQINSAQLENFPEIKFQYRDEIAWKIKSHLKFLEGILSCSRNLDEVTRICDMSVDKIELNKVRSLYMKHIKTDRNYVSLYDISDESFNNSDQEISHYLGQIYHIVDKIILTKTSLTDQIIIMRDFYKKHLISIKKN